LRSLYFSRDAPILVSMGVAVKGPVIAQVVATSPIGADFE